MHAPVSGMTRIKLLDLSRPQLQVLLNERRRCDTSRLLSDHAGANRASWSVGRIRAWIRCLQLGPTEASFKR